MSGPKILALFAGIFLSVVVVAVMLVSAFTPTPPPPSCLPGEACGGPPPTAPPISGDRTPDPGGPTALPSITPAPTGQPGASPTFAPTPAPTGAPTAAPTGAPTAAPTPPLSADLPAPLAVDPAVPALRTWPVHVGPEGSYRLFYPPFLSPSVRADGSVVFGAAISAHDVEVAIRVDRAPASVSPTEMLDRMVEDFRGRVSSMALDDGPEARIHRPTIGHLPAESRTYRGDLGTAGAVRPVALVVLVASDGRSTIAVNVLVTDPDALLPGAEKRWFRLSGTVIDPILKRFEWGNEG